ncbi:MAG TPA: choice-of-anchor Q domain-containing protein [Humisphaera sp.]|jgi:hypothetical protein|nr:choice-of-anchor Q domain-containing protein [Humisphaera sp.]
MRVRNPREYPASHPAARRQPIAEPLEGRALLTSVVVNTTLDQIDPVGSPTVSLRDAVTIANTSASATAITFSPAVFAIPKTITLSKQLVLSNAKQATSITGPAAGVTLNGNGLTRAFKIQANVTAAMSRLTFTNGAAEGTSLPADRGGAIENSGHLTLNDSLFVGNKARHFGGAINQDNGDVVLTNVTLEGNVVTGTGAGGAISSFGPVRLNNVTIAKNTAPAGGGINVNNQSGRAFRLANTIVAGNIETLPKTGDAAGTFVSLGFNLIGNTAGSSGWVASDLKGNAASPIDPKVGPLADNGRPTLSMLPLPGSPVIDKGSNALIPAGITADQRGLPRIFNGVVDIGAVEAQPLVQITAAPKQSTTLGTKTLVALGSFLQFGATGPFKVDVNWGDGSPDTVLTLSAVGAIPATNHTFLKGGSLTVSEVITDAKGNKSNTVIFTDVVTVPPSSISGKVFDDANGDGKIDNGEFGVGLWTVYLDLNNNGKLDAGDRSATTDIGGNWAFTGLAAGSYVVRLVPVTGIITTQPAGGILSITLAAGQASVGNLFGEKALA